MSKGWISTLTVTRSRTHSNSVFFYTDFLCMTSQVMGDALGWGFVVRGMAPCYVQAVDPGSPAAAGGVKVGFSLMWLHINAIK